MEFIDKLRTHASDRFPGSLLDWVGGIIGALAGYLFLVLTFWPGMADGDTIELIWYARAGFFSTYQSPMLGVIWQALDSLGGSSMIFYTQALLVVATAAAILGQWFKGRVLFILVPLLIMSPSVGPYAGTLVKDVWFACSFLLGLVAYWRFRNKGGFIWLALFGLGMVFALQFRPNGIFGILPIAIDCLITGWRRREWIRPILVPGLVTLVAAIIALKATTPFLRLFYRIDFRPAEQVIYLSDLAALTLATGDWLIPEEANPDNIDETRLREIYMPHACTRLVTYKPHQKDRLLLSQDPEKVAVYRAAWIEAIRKYPGHYLARRWEVFNFFFGFTHVQDWYYQKVSGRYGDDPVFERKGWSDRYLGMADWLEANTRAASLWPYILMGLLVGAISLWRRFPGTGLGVLLALTSLSYSLGFAGITYHTGFRYYWFSAFAGMLLLVSLLGHFIVLNFKPRDPA